MAGIGNTFTGDDGFGVAVASRLAARSLPEGVDVLNFAIRGRDAAHAWVTATVPRCSLAPRRAARHRAPSR
ncbi:MAG: hypothetical protein M3308_05495 [Actinomycetota bacterium]|nr:hypothetical protein [Actinomycetota bacterium]